MGLFEKIFGSREEKEELGFSVEEVMPFFKTFGIDIENMGLPCMSLRNEKPEFQYYVTFRDVEAKPVNVGNEVKTEITGEYTYQVACARKGNDGVWHSGTQVHSYFKIRDGRLTIIRG